VGHPAFAKKKPRSPERGLWFFLTAEKLIAAAEAAELALGWTGEGACPT